MRLADDEQLKCDLCRKYKPWRETLAFSAKQAGLKLVDLNGEYPWQGIISICDDCGREIMEAFANK